MTLSATILVDARHSRGAPYLTGKLTSSENQSEMVDEQSHGPSIQNKSFFETEISTQFRRILGWVKEPRHPKKHVERKILPPPS